MTETGKTESFEMPEVRPAVPEMVPDGGYRPEIGGPVLDRLRREDGDGPPPIAPDIDEVIRRRKDAESRVRPVSSENDGYLVRVKADLDEAKGRIEHIATLIGAFGERSFADRLFHFIEYRNLQREYEEAIQKEHRLEELLRLAKIGNGNGS
jgi:hypothetical protein